MKKKLLTERFQQLAGLKPLYTLNEAVDLGDIMQGDKFKEGIFLSPSKFYKDKAEVEEFKLEPLKIEHEEETEKYAEAYRLQLTQLSDGKVKSYAVKGRQAPFDNNREGEVADLITYEEALAKLR